MLDVWVRGSAFTYVYKRFRRVICQQRNREKDAKIEILGCRAARAVGRLLPRQLDATPRGQFVSKRQAEYS